MQSGNDGKKLLSPKARLSRSRLAIYSGLTALVGIVVVVVIFAATSSLSLEAESGTLSGGATVVTDANASGGKAVHFASGATATPTPSPSSTPVPGGFPDASSTGVPAGTTLSAYTGPSTITTAGTVINAKTVTSCLVIKAANVSITNSLIRVGCGQSAMITASSTSLLVSDTEFDGLNNDGHETGIIGSGFTCTRCKIHGVGEGFNLSSDATITDSYVYDLFGGGSSHNNAIITNGGSNFTITHNNLHAIYSGNYATSTTGISSSLSLFGDFGTVSNVLIQNNLISSGGGYCTYGGSVPSKAYPHANNIRYLNNQFSTAGSAKCGEYGVVADFDSSEPGNQWTNNTWADGPNAGKAITP